MRELVWSVQTKADMDARLMLVRILPGLLMVGLFLAYIVIQGMLKPTPVPVDAQEPELPLGEKLWLTVTTLLPAGQVPVAASVLAAVMASIRSQATP